MLECAKFHASGGLEPQHIMKKTPLLIIATLLVTFSTVRATTFTIDSLDGDITANELNQFISSINTLTPPTNNWGDNMSTHGTDVQGMQRMYEATHNISILNTYIKFMDVALSHRNDQPLGEHRVMWTGNVEPAWPESSTSTTPACTTGQIHGNIAYCAYLILQDGAIWNDTVPDGNPNGYGVTYKERALTYLSKVDQGLSEYLTVWFVNPNTYRIQTPTDSRWSSASGNDTAETAWNRQSLFSQAYDYAARCHDLLGDNPSFLPLYKGVVNAFATWFVTAYPNGGAVYYSGNGHNVAKWYYQVPTDNHIENIGHAQHDIVGLYEAYDSGFTGVTHSQIQVYADTTQYIINLGATNSWAPNVDGSGTASASLKADFIFLGQWNRPLYKMIGQCNIDDNQLNASEGCKTTAYILWMKHWAYLQSAQDFSISVSPASQSVTPGGGASYTATITANNGFNNTVMFSVSGLPAGATGNFSPTSVTGSGSSTLSVTTSSSTPAGSYTLRITGTSGSLVHSATVNFLVSDFTISATPSSQTVQPGNGTSYTVNLGNVNAFSGSIALSAGGLPAGASASFNPAAQTAPGSSTMTVTTSSSTPIGTDTLTITGKSGSLSHNTTVSLTVSSSSTNNFAGVFQIKNEASGLVLNNQGSTTNGSAITQWNSISSTNLDWTFMVTSNGYYQIKSSRSGLDAVVQGASTTNGARIVQWSFGSSGDDQWKPVANSDGSYTFYNLKSGLVLSDPNSSTNKTTQMDQETANGGSNQKWTLLKQ